MAKNTAYRLALDSDCECAELLKLERTSLPGYHPYVVTGDFNHDGEVDFAVVLMNRSLKVKRFTLLIFNGPYNDETTYPNFVRDGLELHLGFGPWTSPRNTLLVGHFHSDYFTMLKPAGKTYVMAASDF